MDDIKSALKMGEQNDNIKCIIDDILLIDEQARNLTREAMDERIRSKDTVEARKKELEEKYRADAEEKIGRFKAAQAQKDERLLAAALQNEKAALEHMNALAKEKHNLWVEQMTKGILD